MKFWNIFVSLCNNVGKAPNAVAKEIGISSGAITFWKKDERRPTPRMLDKIAKYFDVSIDYLLGYEKDIATETSEEKEKTPDEQKLTEGEKLLLQLFRQVPEEKQPHLIQLIKVALGMQ